MQAWIVYLLALLFFLALPLVVLLIMEDPKAPDESKQKQVPVASPSRPEPVTYGIVAVLLALMVAVAIAANRQR
ncbi:MAG: hypothetical protein JO202_03795 [Ktedonobacteraceae bacterium]|nr:hypothetical protein [Ktedonobacteraceae bacterium]